jgi:hypothetical protein
MRTDKALACASLARLRSCLHLIRDAKLVLHVVADLVRDDVCLGEVAGRLEAVFQILIESEVDVHRLIGRAIEGPHRRLAGAAGGRRRSRVEDELRVLILVPGLPEYPAPRVLGIRKHLRHEACHLVAGRRPARGHRLGRRGNVATREKAEHHRRIDAEEVARRQGEDDRADADAANADTSRPLRHGPLRHFTLSSVVKPFLVPRLTALLRG